MIPTKIQITSEFDFAELQNRLRKVQLRGFPEVRIYQDADITVRSFSPEQVQTELFTPQPSVYQPNLKRVEAIANLFLGGGINIFNLTGGVDYIATDPDGEDTGWTMIPSVVEVVPIEHHPGRGLDYAHFIGSDLRRLMHDNDYRQNPQLKQLNYPEYHGKTKVPEICDGSHRIEVAKRQEKPQNILVIENMTLGFPYYAAPKPYSKVHEEPERIEEKLDKTHVLTSPGHKQLYRLFPSGGINSGVLRPRKEQVD